MIAVVPPIQKFRSNWTFVQRAFRVAIYLVRLDGVIYATGATYTYTPQPGPLDDHSQGKLSSPTALGPFDDAGGLVVGGGCGGPSSHIGSTSSPANSVSSHSLQSPTEQQHGFFNHTHPLPGNLTSQLYSPTDVHPPPNELSGHNLTPSSELPLHQRRNQPCPPPLNLPQSDYRSGGAAGLASPQSLTSPHSLTSPEHLTSPPCIHSPHLQQSPVVVDGGYGLGIGNHGNDHMTHVVSSPPHHAISQASEMHGNSYHDNYSTGHTSYYYSLQ